MKSGRTIGLGVVVLAFGSTSASACGTCVAAGLDLMIPPVLYWTALAVTWFLSMSILSTVTGHRFVGQPRLPVAVGILVLTAAVGSAVLGPIPILPLAIPPLHAFIRATMSRPQDPELQRLRRRVVVVGLVHVAAVFVGAFLLVHTLNTRGDGEYICQWSGTAFARSRFAALMEAEPQSADEYRHIIDHGSGWLLAQAAGRIAVVGSLAADGERLRKARANAAGDEAVVSAIDAALLALDQRRGPGAE